MTQEATSERIEEDANGELRIDPSLREAIEELSRSIQPDHLQQPFFKLLCEVKAMICNALPNPLGSEIHRTSIIETKRIAKLRQAAHEFMEACSE